MYKVLLGLVFTIILSYLVGSAEVYAVVTTNNLTISKTNHGIRHNPQGNPIFVPNGGSVTACNNKTSPVTLTITAPDGTVTFRQRLNPGACQEFVVGSNTLPSGNYRVSDPMDIVDLIGVTGTATNGVEIRDWQKFDVEMFDESSQDGQTKVSISVMPAEPVVGQPLNISLNFTNANGNNINHQNYALNVMQNGNDVLNKTDAHTHTGMDTQTTQPLTSEDPVDIKVTLRGVGLPNDDPATWTGPKGDTVNVRIIPEFGSLAPIILTISLISVIVLIMKSRRL